jgi:hypothetical protein
MTPHVFISYRRQNTSTIDKLVAALGDARPVWRDTEAIGGGQDWREAIVAGIDGSYALLLVISAETEASKRRKLGVKYILQCIKEHPSGIII